jgi:PEP-CTERM motif
MRKLFLAFLPAIAVLLSITAAARADDLFSFIDNAGNTLTFSLPGSPAPSASSGGTFVLDNVDVLFNGTATQGGFGFTAGGGWALGGPGFSLQDDAGGNYQGRFTVDGPTGSLFTGTLAKPIFLTGTFTGASFFLPSDPGVGSPYTLTITAIPEPSSLMMLGSGMSGLFGMAKRLKANR